MSKSPAVVAGHTRRAPHMEKYVEIAPVVMDGFPDAHHVFLKVTNQSFCVSPHGCETKEDAEWTRDMLCVALEKIASENKPAVNTHAELIEALKPFAEYAAGYESHDGQHDFLDTDTFDLRGKLTVGHLRAALKAIALAETEEG